MIITGESQSAWRTLADTLMNTEDGQRARLVEIRGLAAETVYDALGQMHAMSLGTMAKRFYYHASISPRADEPMTEEQWEKAADALEQALGLAEQPRIVVEHEKGGRSYRHVVWSRVNVDTMTVIPDNWSYLAHQRTADALEKEFGHKATPRRLAPGGPEPKPRDIASRPRRRSGSEKRKRSTPLHVRLSPDERAAVVAASEAAGLTISSYIRSRILVEPATGTRRRPSADTAALAKMLGLANRAGTSLDQLARAHSGNVPLCDELNAASAANREAVEAVLALMGRG